MTWIKNKCCEIKSFCLFVYFFQMNFFVIEYVFCFRSPPRDMNTPEGCGGTVSPNSLQHQRNQNFAVEMAMAHIMRGGPAPLPVSWSLLCQLHSEKTALCRYVHYFIFYCFCTYLMLYSCRRLKSIFLFPIDGPVCVPSRSLSSYASAFKTTWCYSPSR